MKIALIVEKSNGKYWGRLYYEDNLIVDRASSLEALQRRMYKLLKDFHKIQNVKFDIQYDLLVFFERFAHLKKSQIADLTGIDRRLLGQYASGIKYPSEKQTKKIEAAVQTLEKESGSATLHTIKTNR